MSEKKPQMSTKKKVAGTVLIFAVAFAVIAVTLYYGLKQPVSEQSSLDLRINELKSDGYNVANSPMTFSELKAERTAEGGVFSQTTNWSIFKQQIETTKENVGFVTVYACRSDNILWIHATETTYYYFKIG